MAIKRKVRTMCQCCGERKDIPAGATYCDDCTTPNVGAMFVITEKSSKGIFAIKGSKNLL